MMKADTAFYGLRMLGQGFAELLFFVPAPLLAAVYLLNGSAAAWTFTLPVCYAAGVAAGKAGRPRRMLTKGLWALAVGILHLSIVLLFADVPSATSLPLLVFSAAAALQGVRAAVSASWTVSFPGSAMLIGVLLHLAGQLAMLPLDQWARYGTLTAICGIAAVILYLFISNDRLLSGETGGQGKAGAAMAAFKRQNRMLTAIFAAVIAVAGLFRLWQQLFEQAGKGILNAILRWLSRPAEEQPQETPALPEAPQLPEAEPASEPAAWLLLLEQVAKVIGIVIAIVLAVLLLVYIGRRLYRLAAAWIGSLMRRSDEMRTQEAGYVDEVEQLMTLTKWREQWKNRLGSLRPDNSRVTWDKMSGAIRIRELYKSMLLRSVGKGYAFKSYLTPQETAEDLHRWNPSAHQAGEAELIKMYDEVRYGGAEPSPEAADRLKKQMESPK